MAQPLKYEFVPLVGHAGQFDRDDSAEHTTRLTDEELESIKKAAFEDGRARAIAEAEATIERKRADATEAAGAALSRVVGGLDRTCAELESAAAALAHTIGRTVGGMAAASAPLDVIGALVSEALEDLTDEVRVTIEVHDAIVGAFETQVATIVEDTGFAGRVRVRGGADNIADCRIDWGEGGLERRVADITARIGERIAAHGIILPPAPAAGETTGVTPGANTPEV